MATLPGEPPVDGLMTREAGPWVLDKLGILRQYVPRFCTACSRKARGWFYVEGFSGPGVNVIRGSGERVWGSPVIAMEAAPPFERGLFVESNARAAEALAARLTPFGDRAVYETMASASTLQPEATAPGCRAWPIALPPSAVSSRPPRLLATGR